MDQRGDPPAARAGASRHRRRRGAAELLAEAKQELPSLPDGACALLARLQQAESPPAEAPQAVALTERAVAVLRLLRGSLSLREIGRELCLSQNTIKTHTRTIYRKLGVSSRCAVTARGREAGIL